jgi:hypothetical protein
MVWVGPAPDERAGWWIYDIQVVPARRRRGYGWALLDAAEREAQRRGADAIGLNVFGGNTAALGLYESSGYHVAAIRMRKPISDRVIRHAAESRGDRKRSDGLSRPVVTTREPQAGRNNRSRFVDHVDRDLGPALGLWASLGAAPAAY